MKPKVKSAHSPRALGRFACPPRPPIMGFNPTLSLTAVLRGARRTRWAQQVGDPEDYRNKQADAAPRPILRHVMLCSLEPAHKDSPTVAPVLGHAGFLTLSQGSLRPRERDRKGASWQTAGRTAWGQLLQWALLDTDSKAKASHSVPDLTRCRQGESGDTGDHVVSEDLDADGAWGCTGLEALGGGRGAI